MIHEYKVFDWNTAAKMIRDMKPTTVYAGLFGDFNNTSDCIFHDGELIKGDRAFLSSVWATPCIQFDDGQLVPCAIFMDDAPDEWDRDRNMAYLLWPESAVKILEGGTA